MNNEEIKRKVLQEKKLVEAVKLLQNYKGKDDPEIMEHLKSLGSHSETGMYPFNCYDRKKRNMEE